MVKKLLVKIKRLIRPVTKPLVDLTKKLVEKVVRIGRVLRVTAIRKVIHLSRKVILPGFQGLSLWEVLFFFGWSLRKGLITQRAASLAFNFFLAMVPFGLLLVILSTYLPFYNIEQDIVPILAGFIPEQLVNNFIQSMHDFENSSVSSLLSVGFVISLYFASNGFAVMIDTFHSTRLKLTQRSWWEVRLVSIVFVIVFLIGLLVSFFILLTEKRLLNSWADNNAFIESHYYTFFLVLNAFFFAVILYFSIASMYYFGPAHTKAKFRFFSAGVSMATVMIIVISVAYAYYVSKFAKYNELYGSIGTIMILLLWIYFVSLALLVGFELNASIHGALLKKRLDTVEQIKKRQEKKY